MALERVYSIYFPMHAFKCNSFSRMAKVAAGIIIINVVKAALETSLGFKVGNFDNESLCLVKTAVGNQIANYSVVIPFSALSAIGFCMTLLILGKLIKKSLS